MKVIAETRTKAEGVAIIASYSHTHTLPRKTNRKGHAPLTIGLVYLGVIGRAKSADERANSSINQAYTTAWRDIQKIGLAQAAKGAAHVKKKGYSRTAVTREQRVHLDTIEISGGQSQLKSTRG